jgi:hypothetical protein
MLGSGHSILAWNPFDIANSHYEVATSRSAYELVLRPTHADPSSRSAGRRHGTLSWSFRPSYRAAKVAGAGHEGGHADSCPYI